MVISKSTVSNLSLHLRAIFNLSLESWGSVKDVRMEEQEASQRKEKRMQVTRMRLNQDGMEVKPEWGARKARSEIEKITVNGIGDEGWRVADEAFIEGLSLKY